MRAVKSFNVLGIYSFVLKLPEDGTLVTKHVGL
jgi:hypothetical protein